MGAHEEQTISAKAGADLSAHQYTIMRYSAAGTIKVASLATTSAICGVLTNKPESGEHATVQYGGICPVVAGAAITVNLFVTTNGSGRAVAVASGGMAIGRALVAAGADGDIVDILLQPPVRWAGAV